MVSIVVKHDLDHIRRQLRKYPKKIKYAQKFALDATAKEVSTAENKAVTKYIDRPTAFTKRLTLIKKARTQDLTAIVFIPGRKEEYMQYHIFGGTETKGKAIAAPVSVKLNKFGNTPKGQRAASLLKKPKHFSGIPKGRSGPAGVWKRMGRKGGRDKLKLMHVYKPSLHYRKRFPYFKIAEKVVTNVLVRNMNREIKKQMDYINRTA